MELKEQILRVFPGSIRERIADSGISFDKLREIRVRIEKPLCFVLSDREVYIDASNRLTNQPDASLTISKKDINLIMELLCNYSLYAFTDEIRNGFITIQGGHRIGLTGSALTENGKVSSIKYISSMNIRIAHEVKGCAGNVTELLFDSNIFLNTLIVSPCGRGKTTLLRDIIRQLSDGSELHRGMNISVIDERSEIGACFRGAPQNDLGTRTDILDGCPKKEGMLMMIRSMAPDIMALDELGDTEDIAGCRAAITCGIGLLATVHGSGFKDIKRRAMLGKMIEEGMIHRFIFLKGEGAPGQVDSVMNENGEVIKNW